MGHLTIVGLQTVFGRTVFDTGLSVRHTHRQDLF